MKILQFCPYYPPHIGGLEKYQEELNENFSKNNIEVTVFTPNIPRVKSLVRKPGLMIIRFPAFEIISGYPLGKIWRLGFWRQYFRLFGQKYQAVFSVTRFFPTSIMAVVYAKLTRTRHLHIEHGSDFVRSGNALVRLTARIYDETLGRLALKLSSLNIAPSKSAARFIAKFDSRKVPVIYRGLPLKELRGIKPAFKVRQRFGGKIIISFAGRLMNGKGVADLMRAVEKMKETNFKLLIIGSGPQEPELKKMVQRKELKDRVVFWGAVPFREVIGILKVTDIFVNPSYNEGLPTSVLEAGICKNSILATDVGGTREIIRHKHSGILIKPRDAGQIKKGLEFLLRNPTKRKELGENAKREITRKFIWRKSIGKYIKLISSRTGKAL